MKERQRMPFYETPCSTVGKNHEVFYNGRLYLVRIKHLLMKHKKVTFAMGLRRWKWTTLFRHRATEP